MKSHWDNIAAETARDAKRGGSEDQSEISVYSDLAGNIFNDLQAANDDDPNGNDDSNGMSVRITIEEEENEDEDGEVIEGEDDDDEEELEQEEDDDEEDKDGEEDDDDEEADADENDDEDEEDDDDEGDGEESTSEEKTPKDTVSSDCEGDCSNIEDGNVQADEYDQPDDEYDDPDDEYDQPEDEQDDDKEDDGFQDLESKDPESTGQSPLETTVAKTAVAGSVICCNGACRWESYYPIFILIITAIDWLFFLGGIIAMNPHPNITLAGPLSPSLASFPFQTIDNWPSCSNQHEHWRLVSSQFTHEGLQHIGGYTALGLVYGIILESTHPYHSILTAVVYQAAVIFGCMGHSIISPYESFIGCSSGVYGLIGCCFSHILLNKEKLDRRVYYGIILTLSMQALFEIVAYCIWFSDKTAYAAHFTALAVGIFIGISFGIPELYKWKKISGGLGFTAFCILTVCLTIHYSSDLLQQLSTDKYTHYSCCRELLSLVGPHRSYSEARNSFNCSFPSTRIKR